MTVFAHSLEDNPKSRWETMEEHERRVAAFARRFLRRIEPTLEPWGNLLGGWHDLGKYSAKFQGKLEGDRVQIDHAAPGAVLAAKLGNAAYPIAFAIAGHHTGLANLADDGIPYGVSRKSLQQRLRQNLSTLEEILSSVPESLQRLSLPALPAWLTASEDKNAFKRSLALFTRMLFSALVDADRLATAEFYALAEGKQPEQQTLRYDSIAVLSDRLDAFVDRLTVEAAEFQPSAVNRLREEILRWCREASLEKPGFFSLTAPTGGGKTLAAMSGALRHAARWGLDRVIVIIPFTSIIEQNAKRYREALGVDGLLDTRNVLEHHSSIDEQAAEERDSEVELKRRLAAENWDAPIVVSTSVQFFESLFSDHPSRCRKLHRIAKSVIILDEVQTLPPALLAPILGALKELAEHYGCTVILSTATPPALAAREGCPWGLNGIRPIIEDAVALAASPAARRVGVSWRVEQVTEYDELAGELSKHRQVLVVVHRRKDARLLAEMLPDEGRFHLSALMCPAHRIDVLGRIEKAVKGGRVCRVVSTQLIEAGVDLDLPVVYRALAGVDSLVQAAGRCDREGKRSEAAGSPAGQFVVYRAATLPPSATLRRALATTETLLGYSGGEVLPGGLDLFNPEHCDLFFRELYGKEDLDARGIEPQTAALNFANIATLFRMIEDGWSRPLAVPWGEGRERIDAFLKEPCRRTIRALQPFIVQLSKSHLEQFDAAGVVELWEGMNLYLPTPLFGNRYSEEFGVVVDPDMPVDPEVYVV